MAVEKVWTNLTISWHHDLEPHLQKQVHGPVKATLGATPETAVTVEFEYHGLNSLNDVWEACIKESGLAREAVMYLFDVRADLVCDTDPTFRLTWWSPKES